MTEMTEMTFKGIQLVLQNMQLSKRLMSSLYINATEEVEIELMFRTPMFFILLDHYRLVLKHSIQEIHEISYRYYGEHNSVLRKHGPTYQLKSKLSVHDFGPVRIRMSIEQDIEFGRDKNKDKDKDKCHKIYHYGNGHKRIKERHVFKRQGYEIHFTNVNDSDRYIEFELTNNPCDYDSLLSELKFCLKDYQYNHKYIWQYVSDDAISSDMKIVKPIELTRREFRQHRFLTDHFYITNKLDGERKFLLYVDHKMIAVSTKGQHDILCELDSLGEEVWIFDTEYVDHTYHIFDVLVSNGKDVTQRDIMSRLALILEGYDLPPAFTIKKGRLVNTQEQFFRFLTEAKTGRNDGVIVYHPKKGYLEPPFKYKYEPTIDVLTDFRNVYVRHKGIDHKISIQVAGDLKRLIEPEIVECSYVNGQLKPFRGRPDKTKPNSLKLYEGFLEMYEKGQLLSLDSINPDSSDVFMMQVYHNYVKSDILSNLSGHIMDIGSGRGGDLYKWKANPQITHVDSIEPDITNYRELQRRSKVSGYRIRASLINTDLLKYDTSMQYDAITAFFMINCVPPSDIAKFIGKMYELLKPQRSVYILMMDANKVRSNKFIKIKAKTYTLDYPGTMVTNHIEYTYTFEEIANLGRKAGFKITKSGYKVLEGPWLSGLNKEISKMYCMLRLDKPVTTVTTVTTS